MTVEEYISWNDISEEEKVEFFKSNPFKLRNMSKAKDKEKINLII